MNKQPWKILSKKLLLDCWPWLRISSEHVRLPNGVEIPDFYRIDMPEWAQVFALDADRRVVMVEHYKHGAGMVSLELPAGYLNGDEAPDVGARRELLEETGLEALELEFLGRYYIDGNRGCGSSSIFLARRTRRVAAPNLEATELMAQRWLTLDEVRAAWLGGEIHNLATIAAVGLALAKIEGDT